MRSFVKGYTTYPKQLKSIFYIQNLSFYQVSKCFFIERQGKFLRKGGMRDEIVGKDFMKGWILCEIKLKN